MRGFVSEWGTSMRGWFVTAALWIFVVIKTPRGAHCTMSQCWDSHLDPQCQHITWQQDGRWQGDEDYRTWGGGGRRWPSAVMGEFDAWMSSPNSLHPLPPSRTLPRVEGEEGQWLGRITFARMLIYSPTHAETNKLEVMGVERCFPFVLMNEK